MLNVHFVYLGSACAFVGAFFYARDTWRGTTQPNRVTWLLWGAIPMITYAAELQAHVGLRSLMTLAIGIGPFLIFFVSFKNKNAVWKIGTLDYVCGALSVLGVVIWLITQKGMVAIVASIAADALAGVPTVRKAWIAPETESAVAYVGGFSSAFITLLTVQTISTAVVAFPVYIVGMSALELILVACTLGPRWRRRAKPFADATTPAIVGD